MANYAKITVLVNLDDFDNKALADLLHDTLADLDGYIGVTPIASKAEPVAKPTCPIDSSNPEFWYSLDF